MNPSLYVDSYKLHHGPMYPIGTSKIYSNGTFRKSRIPGIDKVVWFGMQHFILDYFLIRFQDDFFDKPWDKVKDEISKTSPESDVKNLEALWLLGYLPIEIKSLDEGTRVPIGVPAFTITNTLPEFYWLVNRLETLISTMIWQPCTSATIAYEYKRILTQAATETGGDLSFIQWQGHDFSMRGMSSVESAILSGMGHLTSFTGTDTIPAIYQLEKSYLATGLIGASVPATEHSIQCMHYNFETGEEDQYLNHLLNLYPTGIVSMVSDGFNLWDVITKTLPKAKDRILARDGKLVIRPDSGDPVDILCGIPSGGANDAEKLSGAAKGVIELLWDIFGGTTNDKGFKVLNPHIGAIYGDSITLDRSKQICERLKAKGFASTNVVLGIGSYTYQYNTRDTFGFAIKATYGEINGVGKEIYKDPITDDGTKKSKKGLLQVIHNGPCIECRDQRTWEQEEDSLLTTVFKDGKLTKTVTLDEIRARLCV